MRHLEITRPRQINKKYPFKISEYIVTITSNNFGDQVMTLRKYFIRQENDSTISGYETLMIDSNPENEHMTDKQIIKRFKDYLKLESFYKEK